MRNLGCLIFGAPITIGVIALLLKTYNDSGGQYLIEYSTLEQVGKLATWIFIGLVVYGICWLISPFAADINKANVKMVLDIWKDHTKMETDKEGDVIAYRYFHVTPNGVLHSVSTGAMGKNPITNRRRGSYAGGYNISDRVPTFKNTSGIYAAKTKHSPALLPYQNMSDVVLAQVKLSGRIIEAEYGYRAQYCEIIKVYEEKQNGYL